MRLVVMVTWVMLVFAVMLMPFEESALPTIGTGFIGLDKFAHAGIFAITAIIFSYGLRRNTGLILTCGFLLGVMTEIAQGFTPTRNTSMLDFIADMVGFSIGMVLLWIWGKRRQEAKR